MPRRIASSEAPPRNPQACRRSPERGIGTPAGSAQAVAAEPAAAEPRREFLDPQHEHPAAGAGGEGEGRRQEDEDADRRSRGRQRLPAGRKPARASQPARGRVIQSVYWPWITMFTVWNLSYTSLDIEMQGFGIIERIESRYSRCCPMFALKKNAPSLMFVGSPKPLCSIRTFE